MLIVYTPALICQVLRIMSPPLLITPVAECAYDMSMNTDFPSWLLQELEKRGWLQAELARRASLSRQAISDYINGKRRNYNSGALVSIAKAFDLPPGVVFRAAGIMPPDLEQDEALERIDYLYDSLKNPANKRRALEFFEYLKNQDERDERDRRKRVK